MSHLLFVRKISPSYLQSLRLGGEGEHVLEHRAVGGLEGLPVFGDQG